MKQSDIITVILIAAVGVVVSAFACNALLGDPDEASVSFKTVETIESALAQPDAEVFNSTAVNPTVEVYVGNCEDVDQDGTLDSAELLACGEETGEAEDSTSETGGTEATNNTAETTTTTTEDEE